MIDFYRLGTPEELVVPYPVKAVETVSSNIINVLGTLKSNELKMKWAFFNKLSSYSTYDSGQN